MEMIQKSKARLIADEILSECHSDDPLDSRVTLIALVRATGEFVAHIEGSLPDARHLYFSALRANLRGARQMRRAGGRRV
jgi:hypothetical protein